MFTVHYVRVVKQTYWNSFRVAASLLERRKELLPVYGHVHVSQIHGPTPPTPFKVKALLTRHTARHHGFPRQPTGGRGTCTRRAGREGVGDISNRTGFGPSLK